MHSSDYTVYNSPGTGGMFVSGIIAYELVGQPLSISEIGDCHTTLAGFWADSAHCAHTSYAAITEDISHKFRVINSHYHLHNYKLGRQIVGINFNADDIDLMALMLRQKTLPFYWSYEYYAKHRKENWPQFTDDLPNESKLVNEDLLDMMKQHISTWKTCSNFYEIKSVIDVKTIFGLDCGSLSAELSAILKKPLSEYSLNLISQYQKINKKLYVSH